jgi:hypothetical protein
MYRAFNTINCDWSQLSGQSAATKHASNKSAVKASLDSFIKDGVVDGTKLGAKWFPMIKADVFISHAHDDEDAALNCASWLKSEFGLESFIDSCVWGHADDLLKMIDNKYCLNEGRDTYSYEKRNQSTSHVHMMLVTALTEMIDAAECTFFINTLNSITSEEAVSKTKSPWLFYELGVMRTLRRKVPQRLQILKEDFSFGTTKKAAELKVEYVVPLSELTPLSVTQLNKWMEKSASSSIQGMSALDLLYEDCPETK